MTKKKLLRRLAAGAAAATIAAAGFLAPTLLGGSTAGADQEAEHYYLMIGGTGDAPRNEKGEPVEMPDPKESEVLPKPEECTNTYRFGASDKLSGQNLIGICYPAGFGPVFNSYNEMPALGAPSPDTSVAVGVKEATRVLTETHTADPDATFTLVGFSQGAWVMSTIAEKVAKGEIDVPADQVDAKLYADPRQPGTGAFKWVPKGVGIPGIITSPGVTTLADFPGVDLEWHCMSVDAICNATELGNLIGTLTHHNKYSSNGVITETIASPVENGKVFWHGEDGAVTSSDDLVADSDANAEKQSDEQPRQSEEELKNGLRLEGHFNYSPDANPDSLKDGQIGNGHIGNGQVG